VTRAEQKNSRPGYSRDAERGLMRSIHETCGALIAEAAGGDLVRGALLAAITANESGGCRSTHRFVPAHYQRLLGLLNGAEQEVGGLTRARLEKQLSTAGSDAERAALLKKLAGLYGYTQIPGYYSIVWKIPLEALAEKGRHFQFAALLLDRFCKEFNLDPAVHAAELGRCWNAGHPNGRTRSALYSWRLLERIRLYREIARR
jgi:hypothetical protein